MAEGLAPKLPLYVNSTDSAYALIKDVETLAKQNLKNLILTGPGERVMIPEYGVGVRRMLFEQITPQLRGTLKQRIIDQIAKYTPYILINKLEVTTSDENARIQDNAIYIKLVYNIRGLAAKSQSLNIEVV